MGGYGMQYDLMFQVACQQFIATNETALRALLGEFMTTGRGWCADARTS